MSPFAVDTAVSDSISPVLLTSALTGAISASLVILSALRALLERTIGRRRKAYRRLARLGTGAQVPFFSSALGEPPAIQYTVLKEDYMVLLDRDDPGWDPEKFQTKPEPREFKISVFIDRDYYVQAVADGDQTVLAYSVTTRSRRFRPSIWPVPPRSLRHRLLRRPDWMMPRREPRIVLGRTKFADLDATDPDYFAPPRLRLRIGAHNFDYTETAYYGNPGRYQSFAWSASDVARQGPIGNLGKARTDFPQVDPDEWSRVGSSDEWPDWSELPELQRFRRDTAITTYTVCDVKLTIENYPLGRFGVGEHEVRTLWRTR